jgi:aminoglycoside phosphotransferase family enzyme/predicted kinase
VEHDAIAAELIQQGFQLIETHISRVYLTATDVFKTKRPVALGFLDFRSLDDRARACDAEVALNGRLAAGVYLGVLALVRGEQGALEFVARDEVRERKILDFAVHMRRLSDEARADTRLARGLFDRDEAESVARTLAAFHLQARSDAETAAFGTVESVARNLEENFAQVEAYVADHLTSEEVREVETYQRAFLAAHAPLVTARAEQGFVRDGHGDLRLEHVYRQDDGSHVVIDCIEFNQRFRFADVCADLAFLSMDLRSHVRDDVADLLVAAYAEASGDYGLYALLDFYESYRAFVRGKVASFLAHDEAVRSETRDAAKSAARRHFLLALSAARPRLVAPRLIVCMGTIASGKSTLANGLATRLGAGVLCADRVRKQLLAVPETTALHDAPFQGNYTVAMSERVYTLLRERAAAVLASGRSVIVDASFRERRERNLLRHAAAQLGVEAVFLECRCDRGTAMKRLTQRASGPSVSDGRAEIYDSFAASFEPLCEIERSVHHVLDTDQPADDVLATALRCLL